VSWFLAAAGFAVLIILHEFGHFILAKRTGMRVERFFLFFPPKLASTKRGETEYGIGWIPLGGFVKISGMNPEEELPPEAAGRGYYDQPVWKRVVVIGAGPAMNLLLAFLLLFALAFGIKEAAGSGLEVGDITGAPADGRLEVGDRIISIDGVSATKLDLEERSKRLREQVGTHQCAGEPQEGCRATTPARIVVERDGRRVPLSIRPRYDAEAEQNRIGFIYQPADLVDVNPSAPGAAGIALDQMWFVTSRTVSVIAQLFKPEQRDELSGVVGGYEVTRQAIEFDTRTALTLIALISLSLGVINLFPFLPLDGGHIFWSVVEKVRGRPVPFSVMERAGVIGFMFVILIFFIGLSNDIGRLSGEGFQTR
jgi:regulator of sigma E protease